MPDARKTIVGISLLLYALTLLAYAPALRGGFIWDDDDYVENNANLRSPRGLIERLVFGRLSRRVFRWRPQPKGGA